MPLETWKAISDWSAIVLVALTVVSGSAALILGKRINDNQQERLQQFDKGLTDAKTELKKQETRAAEAEAQVEGLRLSVAEANKQAEEAKEHVARANLELARIKSPRSLTNISDVISALRPFSGTEYTFDAVFQDSESIEFLKTLDGTLRQVGWKRIASPRRFPSIEIYGANTNLAVPVSFATGLDVSIDSEDTFNHFRTIPVDKLPEYAQAAITLCMLLSSRLSPPQKENLRVNIREGTSPVIRITIGQKPTN